MTTGVYAERLRGLLAHIEGSESPDWKSLVKVARDCERIRRAAKLRPDITTAAIEIRVLTRPNEVAILAKELTRSVSTEVAGAIKTAVVLFYSDPDLNERVCRPLQWTRDDGTVLAIGAKRGRVTAIEAIQSWIRTAAEVQDPDTFSGQPASDIVDSDFAEPILKSDLAVLFGVSSDTIARRIRSGELRTIQGTLDTAKKVRIHSDDFPPGLKRSHERKQKLSEDKKHGRPQ